MLDFEHVRQVQIEELQYDASEPESVKRAAARLAENGFLVPIVISSDYRVLSGNLAVAAASVIGMDSVPCISEEDFREQFERVMGGPLDLAAQNRTEV